MDNEIDTQKRELSIFNAEWIYINHQSFPIKDDCFSNFFFLASLN